MAFKREMHPRSHLEGKALTAALVGIGMAFAAHPAAEPNIEDTLLAASIEGMARHDLRVLAVLTTWLEVHAAWINADRMTALVNHEPEARTRAYWSAIARMLGKDRRFARMAKAYKGRKVDLLETGTDFQIQRKGEDPRFEGSPLRVPAGTLRDRQQDVLTPAELARRHRAYRARVLLGPSYRADMWAELDREPDLSPAELARRCYGSFATAWHVKRDWGVVGMAG